MGSERERLLERLKGIKALAERGSDGERDNAVALLESLMQKYGITEADLENDQISTHWIPYKTIYERKLLFQLSYMHLGKGHASGAVGRYTGRRHKKVGIDCTPAQYIEIIADYQFYREALEEEMDIFYSAFIQKNDLFPPTDLAGPQDDSEPVDTNVILKMQAMMEGIEHRTRHKAIAESNGE